MQFVQEKSVRSHRVAALYRHSSIEYPAVDREVHSWPDQLDNSTSVGLSVIRDPKPNTTVAWDVCLAYPGTSKRKQPFTMIEIVDIVVGREDVPPIAFQG